MLSDEEFNTVYHSCCVKECLREIPKESLKKFHLSTIELDGDCKDMFLIGLLSSCTDLHSNYSHYRLFNAMVCKNAFIKIVGISHKVLKNIKAHLKGENYNPRIHGNNNNLHNSSTAQQTEEVVNFLAAKAAEVGNPYPVSRKWESPKIVLPCDYTKHKMYEEYKILSPNPVGLSTFKTFWKDNVPHVVTGKPRFDVCVKCEDFKNNIKSCEPYLKESLLDDYEAHKQCFKLTREHYNLQCTYDNHITFDFSQNMLLPHYTRQRGSMYFLAPLKVFLFGIANEHRCMQMNFLYTENQTVGYDGESGHGPIAVSSMLYYYLKTFYIQKQVRTVYLHADNCCAQNKNFTVLAFLNWLIASKQMDYIELSFMITGHTRSRVDSGFGSIKKLFNSSDVSNFQQLLHVAASSSMTNTAIAYPTWQWIDFSNSFPTYRHIPGITKYHNFVFSKDHIHVVNMKVNVNDSQWTSFNMLKSNLHAAILSPEALVSMIPKGFSNVRKQYLIDKVAPLVVSEHRASYLNNT